MFDFIKEMCSPQYIDKIAPTIMIGLSAISFVVYMCCGDYKQATYWFAGSLITYSVTWM